MSKSNDIKKIIRKFIDKTWVCIYTLGVILKVILRILFSTIGFGFITGATVAFVIVILKVGPLYVEYNRDATAHVNSCDYDTFRMEESSYIYDDSGEVIIKLRGNQDSSYLKYEDMPEDAINAFIAVEDRTFWENPGIDLKGIIRVIIGFFESSGEEVHGASTITQQLARNVFLTHEVSIERKAKEMLIALKLTEKFSKEDIIEFYVNDICYANGIYGLDAAAKGYFNKSSDELSLSEIAYLCAIPNSPTYYDPYKYPERALERRDKILGDMYEVGYITRDEYEIALDEEIDITKPEYDFKDYQATYAIDCAVKELMRNSGFDFQYSFRNDEILEAYNDLYDSTYESCKNKLYTGGYQVYTSLNSEKQQILQSAIDNKLAFSEDTNEEGIYQFQSAATLIDNETGKVVAIVGGRSQEQETYSLNRAYQSYRQPGSSIKPLIVYGPAIDNGYTSKSKLTNISVTEAKKKGVKIEDLTGNQVELRKAVEKSLNGCAWWLFEQITPTLGISYITDMEFSKIVPDDYFPAASLGGLTYGVTTVEMASGYSTLENDGVFRTPTCITSIIDHRGDEVYRGTEEKEVYSENAAREMIDILQGVISNGTASSMRWSKSSDVEAAGKTGTTNGGKDGWFCGVTPYYSLAVWVGYDIPKELSSLYGGTYPAEIWKDAMLGVLDVTETSEENNKFKDKIVDKFDDVSGPLAWDQYLPGRLDEEELSPGYTVADYRNDHTYGDQAMLKISKLADVYRNRGNFEEFVEENRAEIQELIDKIYGQTLKAEVQKALDDVVYSLLHGDE